MKNVFYMGVVVPLSILIPIIFGISCFQFSDRALKTIFFYLLMDGVVNLIAVGLANFHIHNLPLLHIFTILEFLSLGYFYLLVLKERIAGRVIKFLMVLFPLFCVINFLFFQSINHFNTNARPVEALIIIACSLAYFTQTNDAGTKWSLNPVNWISTGILIYFSGALFIFSFSNVTASHMSKKYYAINILMWNIHATLLLIMYLLIAVGFYKCRKH